MQLKNNTYKCNVVEFLESYIKLKKSYYFDFVEKNYFERKERALTHKVTKQKTTMLIFMFFSFLEQNSLYF